MGPGTVITASLAGSHYGYSLLWALLFSVLATLVLQEMVARLALVTGQGLGENLSSISQQPWLRAGIIALVASAIVVGNGAYQGGNISGAAMGLSGVFNQTLPAYIWPLMIGVVAFALLWSGSYRLIERALSLLVALMSLAFVATMLLTKPDLGELFSGLLIPSLPTGASLTAIALIGTTVVPYNLFLYASSVCKKWQGIAHLPAAKQDLRIAIPLGGLISVAIVSIAASAFFAQQIKLHSAADLAPAIRPLFGDLAGVFIALGLFIAGISSAITAPLAAAYALCGVLNKPIVLSSWGFRSIWLGILLLGVVIASTGFKPVSIIWFAQVANGLLLPIVVSLILWLMNSTRLGEHKNNLWQNICGGVVLLVTLLLSGKSLLAAFGAW